MTQLHKYRSVKKNNNRNQWLVVVSLHIFTTATFSHSWRLRLFGSKSFECIELGKAEFYCKWLHPFKCDRHSVLYLASEVRLFTLVEKNGPQFIYLSLQQSIILTFAPFRLRTGFQVFHQLVLPSLAHWWMFLASLNASSHITAQCECYRTVWAKWSVINSGTHFGPNQIQPIFTRFWPLNTTHVDDVILSSGKQICYYT